MSYDIVPDLLYLPLGCSNRQLVRLLRVVPDDPARQRDDNGEQQ
jgi:hypothetical protein